MQGRGCALVVGVFAGLSGCELERRAGADAGRAPEDAAPEPDARPVVTWVELGEATPSAPVEVAASPCNESGWCWARPGPQGAIIRDAWAAESGEVWAVGFYGTILHHDGEAWSISALRQGPDRPVEHINAIEGLAHDDIWAVTSHGSVLRYNGERWTAQELEGFLEPNEVYGSAMDLWVHSPDEVWISSNDDKVARFDGERWTVMQAVSTPAGYVGFWEIDGSGPNDVWLVGHEGQTWHWDGDAWAEIEGRPEHASTLLVRGDGEAWVGGEALYRWDGSGFRADLPAPPGPIRDLEETSAGEVWAVGKSSVYRLDDGSWRGAEVLSEDDIEDGSRAPSGLSGIAVSADRQVATSLGVLFGRSGEGEWARESDRGVWGQTLGHVWGNSEDDIWASAEDALVHWDGDAWTSYRSTELTASVPGAIWGSGPNDVYACRDERIVRWDGETWSVAHALSSECQAISGTGADDVWVAALDGISRFDGEAWSTVREGVDHARAVWALARDDVWYGDRSGFYQFDGEAWTQRFAPNAASPQETPAPPPLEARGIWASGPSDVWFASDFAGGALRWNGEAIEHLPFEPAAAASAVPAGHWGPRSVHVFGAGRDAVWVVRAAQAFSPSTVSTMYHWDGDGWQIEHAPTDQVLGLWADERAAWAVGHDGAVLRKPLDQ